MYEEEGRFICPVCDYTPDSDEDAFLEYDHCPDCLSAIHEYNDDEEVECGGTYEPIGMWVQGKGQMGCDHALQPLRQASHLTCLQRRIIL